VIVTPSEPIPATATSDVSVVIAAYTERRLDSLADAIASVAGQRPAPLEVIVVIDRNDALLEQVRDRFPDVVALANDRTPGAGGARNTGVAVAHGSVIAFLDDDAVARERWLERIEAALVDPMVVGVGGDAVPGWVSGRPRWFPLEFDWVVGCSYLGLPTRTAPVRNVFACNMAMRRSVFLAVGGYQDGLGNAQVGDGDGQALSRRFVTRDSGCEETELCIRAARVAPGSHWLYDPAMRVDHVVPESRTTVGYFLARCHDEGLAKARVVVEHVGSHEGLSTERGYVARTLPLGVARGLGDLVRSRDPAGPLRATAIVAGLGVTTFGYVRGRLSARTGRRAA
jgi:hypothetical protein